MRSIRKVFSSLRGKQNKKEPIVQYDPRNERVTIGSELWTHEMPRDSRDESGTIRPDVDSHVLPDTSHRHFSTFVCDDGNDGQPIPQPLSPGESNLRHKDILRLAEFGLIVTADTAGGGTQGEVLVGYYGNTAISTFVDINGNPINGVVLGKKFALKYIDFDVNDTSDDAIEGRYSMIMERSVRANVDHPNIVPIRLVFSWGNPFFFRTGGKPYQIKERVYIVMDFADFGSLEAFLWKLDSKKQRLDEYYYIKFIVELYSGLKHLHDHNIYHSDLHDRNVLVFNEGTDEQPVLTLKISDFGMSYICEGKYLTTPSVPDWRRRQVERQDIMELADIVQLIHGMRPIDCSQRLCDIITELISRLKTCVCDSLAEVKIVAIIDSLLNYFCN